jgi:hypothetical protein
MDKVHFKQGDYVEKLCSCKISTLLFINMKHTLWIIDSPSYCYRIKELRKKLVSETSLNYDARSEKHQIMQHITKTLSFENDNFHGKILLQICSFYELFDFWLQNFCLNYSDFRINFSLKVVQK